MERKSVVGRRCIEVQGKHVGAHSSYTTFRASLTLYAFKHLKELQSEYVVMSSNKNTGVSDQEQKIPSMHLQSPWSTKKA